MSATSSAPFSESDGLGTFNGKAHLLPLRVYYEDTDLSGMVYHANYLRFMERGRSEFFRKAGVILADLDGAEPTAWAIRRADVQFHRPARIEDALTVRTVLVGLSGARLNALQRIYARGDAGDILLVEGRIEACLVTLTGRPRRIPQTLTQLLKPFLEEAAV